MQTVRRIERLWNDHQYNRLFRELLAHRPEASFRLEIDNPTSAVAAAMGVIRLDELNQSHVPMAGTFIRALVASQEKDGGWGDATVTTLCLRALMTGKNTGGEAIARGLSYLADLQKTDGLWPRIPLRRMPAEPSVSAFVLYQLGEDDRFRSAVRFDDVVAWFEQNQASLEPEVRRLWERAQLRCGARSKPANTEQVLVWSYSDQHEQLVQRHGQLS